MLLITNKEARNSAFKKVEEYLKFLDPQPIVMVSGLPDMAEDEYTFALVVNSVKARPSEHVYENEYTVKNIESLVDDSRTYDQRQFLTAIDKLPSYKISFSFHNTNINIVELGNSDVD